MNSAQPIPPRTRIEIDNRIRHFRSNLDESQNKLRCKSATVRLADEIYSKLTPTKSKKEKRVKHRNKSQSPLKNRKLKSDSKSLEKSNSSNKSTSSQRIMKGLEDRTLCLGELVEKNSSLLVQKRQLEERIAYFKQKISSQNRDYNQSQIKSKQYEDAIIEEYEKMRRKEKAVKQLECKSAQESEQCLATRKQIERRTQENELLLLRIEKIKRENKRIVRYIQDKSKVAKKTSVESSEVKNLLRQSQKRLTNQTVYKEELSNQKANLMIEANWICEKITHIVNP